MIYIIKFLKFIKEEESPDGTARVPAAPTTTDLAALAEMDDKVAHHFAAVLPPVFVRLIEWRS